MMKTYDYESLIARFGSPLKVAYALGFAKPTSSSRVKNKAGARVGMWNKTGIPAKHVPKIERIVNVGVLETSAADTAHLTGA